MQKNISGGAKKGLKTLLLAGCASLAFSAGTSYAQDSTSAPSTQSATITSSSMKYSLEVGNIDAVDSNVDAQTIRDVISGKLVENANALAGLNAKSIFIPEIKLIYTIEVDGKVSDNEFVFKNIALTNVKNGIAQTASMEAVTGNMSPNAGADMDEQFKLALGQSTITQFNLGAVLNAYGLLAPKNFEMTTLYQDYIVSGGSLDAGPVHCDIGKYQAGSDSARAMEVSYPELMTLAAELEANNDPSPEQIVKMADFYADLLFAYKTSPAVFDGLSCAGTQDGTSFDFSLGKVMVGAMGNGIYPSFEVNDIAVKVSGKENGEFKLGNFTFKEIDFNPTVEAYKQIEDVSALNKDWFEANFRSFIPSFGGLSISNFFADVPDEDNGVRIKVEVAEIDVSLADYVNGIPSNISLSTTGLQADVPENPSDDGLKQLRALGIERLNVGYEMTLSWDEAAQAINLARLMFTGEKLGTVDVSGYFVGATAELFATDPQTAMIAAMGLGVKELDIQLDNQGFLDIALAQAAAEQGAPVEAFQTQVSAMANGMIVGLLGGVDQAVDLGAAVSNFIAGDASYVGIAVTSKTETGVGMPQIMALQSDPTKILEYVDIETTTE
jgi:hypothetical protein